VAKARFEREAMIGSRLGHDHIVQVFDFAETPDGEPYIVMELLSGEDLAKIVRREGQAPLERAVSIVRQVCIALSDAHEQGVVHRDLKPENIFICRRPGGGEVAKVLDFGISKVLEATRLTQETVVFGTPWYMAPEQAQGRIADIDRRTDLFAVGLVFYYLLAARLPFTGCDVPALLYQVVHEMPPPLLEVRPDLPPEIVHIVEKSIQKRPEDRYQSAGEVIADLASAMGPRWKTVLAWQIAPELSGDRIATRAVGDAPADTALASTDPAQAAQPNQTPEQRAEPPAAAVETTDAAPPKRGRRPVALALVVAGSAAAIAGAALFLRSSGAPPARGAATTPVISVPAPGDARALPRSLSSGDVSIAKTAQKPSRVDGGEHDQRLAPASRRATIRKGPHRARGVPREVGRGTLDPFGE
jgi:serine/threonine-protein kinase